MQQTLHSKGTVRLKETYDHPRETKIKGESEEKEHEKVLIRAPVTGYADEYAGGARCR